MDPDELQKWREAGKIGAEALDFAKKIIKPGIPLLEFAEKIETFVLEKKAKFAFPINLSIDAVAAHSSPMHDSIEIAKGLLKIDIGVSVQGYLSDCAFSIDLTREKKYTKLIEASEKALEEAIRMIRPGIELREIGKTIQKTISSYGFAPIINLSGHELKQWKLHSGLTIPNYDNGNKIKLEEDMVLAIEPFATTGSGIVQDGKESGIYRFEEEHKTRDMLARQILGFIKNEYHELPFSARWIVSEFGTRALFSLRALEQATCLHHFKQLVEKTRAPVSQAEHTILVTQDGCEILTK
ncbi:MAG: type II methionyl aminopeptidase [Candidatus Pacearchaeota archaeon]